MRGVKSHVLEERLIRVLLSVLLQILDGMIGGGDGPVVFAAKLGG